MISKWAPFAFGLLALLSLPISFCYKEKIDEEKKSIAPMKVVTIEHSEKPRPPKEPSSYIRWHQAQLAHAGPSASLGYYLPTKKYQPSPVVVEESHEIIPENQIDITREQYYVPVPNKLADGGQTYGGPAYGGQTFGGQAFGGQTFGGHPLKISQPNTHFLLHVVPSEMRRKHESSIPDLLALLAPLAAIPLIGSLAVSSFTTMLTLTGLGRRRRKRDLSLHHSVMSQLNPTAERPFPLLHFAISNRTDNWNTSLIDKDTPFNVVNKTTNFTNTFMKDLPIFNDAHSDKKTSSPISELFQLDIVQQYLQQSGRPDHNDQIIANYLACQGMFSNSNKCLERLACHYADLQSGRLRPLERDVAALIIYSLLRNTHIDSNFKRRLQRAALFGYDHMSESQSSTFAQVSFVPVCDREFPCPKSEMP